MLGSEAPPEDCETTSCPLYYSGAMRLSSFARSVAGRRSGAPPRHQAPVCHARLQAGRPREGLFAGSTFAFSAARKCYAIPSAARSFCRRMWRVLKRSVKRMSASRGAERLALPRRGHRVRLWAAVGSCPHPIGHYDCVASTARLLQLGSTASMRTSRRWGGTSTLRWRKSNA